MACSEAFIGEGKQRRAYRVPTVLLETAKLCKLSGKKGHNGDDSSDSSSRVSASSCAKQHWEMVILSHMRLDVAHLRTSSANP